MIYEIFGYSNLTINIVQRMFKKSICLGVFKFVTFGNSKMSAMTPKKTCCRGLVQPGEALLWGERSDPNLFGALDFCGAVVQTLDLGHFLFAQF